MNARAPKNKILGAQNSNRERSEFLSRGLGISLAGARKKKDTMVSEKTVFVFYIKNQKGKSR